MRRGEDGDMKECFERVTLGASKLELDRLIAWLRRSLPEAYLRFPLETNEACSNWGRAGWDQDFLYLSSPDSVVVANSHEDWRIQEYVPGALAIGSCGTDTILLDMDASQDPNELMGRSRSSDKPESVMRLYRRLSLWALTVYKADDHARNHLADSPR